MNVWPNFFIVGVAKAGTTSLYAYLKNIPDIFMSTEKEPHYFWSNSFPSIHNRKIQDEFEYLNLFKGVTNEKAIGEASPGYFVDPKSAKLIHDVIPHAKIIILLRDPVERALSHYLTRKTKGVVKESIHKIIVDYLNNEKNGKNNEFNFVMDPGLYTDNVKRFLDEFGKDSVKIIVFEKFVKEPKKTVKDVLEFLEVNAEPQENIEKSYNVYAAPRGKFSQIILSSDRLVNFSRHVIPQSLRWKIREKILLKKAEKPRLSQDDRILLQDFYRNDVVRLQNLLKMEFPWSWINH